MLNENLTPTDKTVFNLNGYSFKETDSDLWDKLVSITQHLLEVKENNAWQLGDLALFVIDKFGEGALRELIKDTGLDSYHIETLKRYSQVSRAFPKEKREQGLSHRHHMVLQSVPDKEKWLQKANDENISANKLSVIVKDHKVEQKVKSVYPLFLDIDELDILKELIDEITHTEIKYKDKIFAILDKIKNIRNKYM